MNQQSTLEQLQELKLTGMAKRYEAIIKQPVHQQPEPHTGFINEPDSICDSLNYATMLHRNRSIVHPEEVSAKKYWQPYRTVPSLKNQKTC
jgi:hypothetical protein